ncbi:MAG: OmpA family protein [Deltaproteobacteria bacterium]|nr:OmpA family protein [Deltaproteobacteria bacterium]
MARNYLKILSILTISTLLISCGAKKVQKAAPSFEPYKFNANQYVPKVDNFVVILDTSSSMATKYNQKKKANIAKDFLSALNQTLPELKYNGALRIFGNNDYVPDTSTLLVYGPTKYSSAGFGAALNAVKEPSGNSSLPLTKAISAATGDLKSTQGPIAVIIVSDGENMDPKPVKAAEALKKKFGDKLCIFTVLIGDSPTGKQILDQITKAGDCGYSTAADRLSSSGDMAGFVEGIFLAKPAPMPVPKPVAKPMDSDGDGVTDDKDQCPNTPKGATVDARGCWTYAAVVLFGFDSAEIKSEAHPMLDEASAILKKNPDINVEVDGHTDNIGPADYNMKLSERRAKAVMEYFVSKGVDAKRLTIKGFGFTKPVASNDTKEGRAKNRRVELTPVK